MEHGSSGRGRLWTTCGQLKVIRTTSLAKKVKESLQQSKEQKNRLYDVNEYAFNSYHVLFNEVHVLVEH